MASHIFFTSYFFLLPTPEKMPTVYDEYQQIEKKADCNAPRKNRSGKIVSNANTGADTTTSSTWIKLNKIAA